MDLKAKLVELLDEAEEWADHKCDELDCETCPADKMKGNCVQQLMVDRLIAHGVTVQEWISVKDRLPEPGVRVLASDEEFVGEFYINKRGQWQRYNVNDVALLMALDILWWKPLPNPPK